jgi:hypothetical protein
MSPSGVEATGSFRTAARCRGQLGGRLAERSVDELGASPSSLVSTLEPGFIVSGCQPSVAVAPLWG